jgi:hypothetical protein
VTIEPAGPSKVGTAISKVPFLKRLRKTSSELPKPRHEASVGTVHEQLPGPLDVKVQVELTREGRVESANLIEEDLPTQGEFAWASLRAARSWTFQPASDGPNKAVLHFHFEPTER